MKPTLILRIGLGLVLLYFGIMQVYDPTMWTSYLPHGLYDTMYATPLIIMNGSIEIMAAGLLFAGLYLRITSLVMTVHMALITLTIGLNAVGVRDFGLTIALLALAYSKPDNYCLDKD